jgi:hypothetical protein
MLTCSEDYQGYKKQKGVARKCGNVRIFKPHLFVLRDEAFPVILPLPAVQGALSVI